MKNITDMGQVIKELKGWRLVKIKDRHYKIVLPDGQENVFKFKTNDKLAIQDLERAVSRGWVWIEFTHYIPEVEQGKVVVHRRTSTRQSNKDFHRRVYLTAEQAKEAINKTMPKAINKFNECRKALKELEDKLGFSCGDTYEGDTYGIYNEYSYIRFSMDGFEFSFDNS